MTATLQTSIFRSPAFQPLAFRDFRILSGASTLNSFGMLGETVAIGWLVLNMTDSPFMVGVSMALRLAPNFILGIPAGAIADSVDRRLLIRWLNVVMAAPVGALGLLILTGDARLWHVLVLVTAAGGLQSFHQAARASYAYDIVGPNLALHGLSAILVTSRIGGLLGAIAVGSTTARVGADAAFFVLTVIYLLAALTALFLKAPGQSAPIERTRPLEALTGFLKEIRTNRSLLALSISTAMLEMLGFSHQALLPSIARDVLHVDAEGLGFISGIRSLGGLAGVLFLAGWGSRGARGAVYLVVIALFGGSLALLGFASSFVLALIALTILSGMMSLADILSQSLMQLAVSNEFRGRAMGSWVLATGFGPLGSLQTGGLATLAGVTIALSVNGIGLVFLALGVAFLAPRIRRM